MSAVETKTVRNYGVDLLRMLAMYMVLVLHILGRGGVLTSAVPLSLEYNVAWLLETSAYCAVNCYGLISGYVGIKSTYRYSNVINLWTKVLFYSVGLLLVVILFRPFYGGVLEAIKYCLPVSFRKYWYFTAYFAMFFFVPILNFAIRSLTKKQAIASCVCIMGAFSVLQTLRGDLFLTGGGYSALWLIILYYFGGCIREFDLFSDLSKAKAVIGYCVTVTVSWGMKILGESVATHTGIQKIQSYSGILISYISPTILFSAIFLVVLFGKMTLSEDRIKWVKKLSPLAFSVYLIHCHPLVWEIFDQKFAVFASLPAVILILAVLVTAVIIYLCCSLIDYLRELLFRTLKINYRIKNFEEKYIGSLWG